MTVDHIHFFVCCTRQEKQSAGEIELAKSGETEREEEEQQETDSQESSHPRDETEKAVATVAENIRLGAREKSSFHNVEGHISDLGGKDSGPNQVKLSQYPQHNFGVKKRSFKANWFDSFTWLES